MARLQHVRSARLLPLRLLPQLLLLRARGWGAGSLFPGRSPVLLGPRPGQPAGLRRQLGPAAQLRPQSRPGEGRVGGGAGRTGRAGHRVTPGKRHTIPQGWVGGAPRLAARRKHCSGGFTKTSRFLQREQSERGVAAAATSNAAAAACPTALLPSNTTQQPPLPLSSPNMPPLPLHVLVSLIFFPPSCCSCRHYLSAAVGALKY